MSRRAVEPVTAGRVAELAGAKVATGPESAVVSGVSDDSRTVAPGDLFFCVRGAATDGHDMAAGAVAGGAVALVVDHVLDTVPQGTAQILVTSVRDAMGPLVSALVGEPALRLLMIGVTGTNGKTSTAHFTAGILRAAGRRPVVIGTLSGPRTTPEPVDLHSQLADAAAGGADTVVMEVSSHALVLRRVEGITFDVAVFTNLSRDHLDFHGSMEDYMAAKAMLFEPSRARSAVINTDDEHGRALSVRCAVPHETFSRDDAVDARVRTDGVSFVWRGEQVDAPVGGAFAVSNLVAALTVAAACGVPADVAARAAASLVPVPGRFETVPTDGTYSVVVDYAHTPDALASLLGSVRSLATGRMIVVFGCGGDRDRGKRPHMGTAVAGVADIAIVTSDNPRGEDPVAIIADITRAMTGTRTEVRVDADRASAIASAISLAGSGDIVVIAGKGHEPYQEVAGVFVPFSDVDIARDAIERRRRTR